MMSRFTLSAYAFIAILVVTGIYEILSRII